MAVFTDNFTGANLDDVSARTGWDTTDGPGSGSEMIIWDNQLGEVASSSNIGIRHTHVSANHYAQAVVKSLAWVGFLCVRMTSDEDYIGVRPAGSNYEVYKRSNAGFSLLGTTSGVVAALDQVLRLEANGSTIRVLVDAVERLSLTESAHATIMNVGFHPRNAGAVSPMLDDWESGELGMSGTASGILAHRRRMMETW